MKTTVCSLCLPIQLSIDALVYVIQGPCECDVSFASFQICKQSDITLGEGDHASLFDDWLMPEGSEVLSSTSKWYYCESIAF